MNSLNQVTALQLNLEEQSKIYSSLCHLLMSENQYLIQSDVSNINKSASLKESLLREAEKKEQEREGICGDLAKALKLHTEGPRLLEIATKLSEPHRSKLINHKRHLETLFVDIKRLNHENELLAQTALNSINGTIGAIRDALSTKPTYKSRGKVEGKKEQHGHLMHKKA